MWEYGGDLQGTCWKTADSVHDMRGSDLVEN